MSNVEYRISKFDIRYWTLDICTALTGTTPIARHVSTQITRSGTSPFANYGEAQAAESRQDFVHKLKVCLKELRETQAWLKFVQRMNLCPDDVVAVREECNELVAIVVASVRTASGKCKMSNVQ